MKLDDWVPAVNERKELHPSGVGVVDTERKLKEEPEGGGGVHFEHVANLLDA